MPVCPECGKRLKTRFALQGHLLFSHGIEMKDGIKIAREAWLKEKEEKEKEKTNALC